MHTRAIALRLAMLVVFTIGIVAAAQTTVMVTHEQTFLSMDDMFTHNMIVTYHSPDSFVHAELIDIEADTALALPDQEGGEDALLVIYDIAPGVSGEGWGWGGLVIGFDPTDVTQYDGIMFNFLGMGTGNCIDVNIQEGDDFSTAQLETESYTYVLGDNSDGWIVVRVPFEDLVPDLWQSENAVVDGFDGTGIHAITIDVCGAGFFLIEGIQLYK